MLVGRPPGLSLGKTRIAATPSPIDGTMCKAPSATRHVPERWAQNPPMPASPRHDLRRGVTEPVVLMISRREVEAADLASVLSRLKVFRATREDAWRYRGQMTGRPCPLS